MWNFDEFDIRLRVMTVFECLCDFYVRVLMSKTAARLDLNLNPNEHTQLKKKSQRFHL